METVKRLFISLIVLLGCTAGAWAIEQDSDGYYLIGSVQDWKDFAGIVLNTNQAANARMTADINLGDDQARIGDVAGNEDGAKFGGIFDGQGHTLTVAYNITGQNMCAPFTKTNGATIKNLHVAGTMRTEFCHLAGIIADAYGNNTIENVWVSADLTSANNYNSGGRILDLCGAFVGCKKTGTLSISNGLFSGSITTENESIWNGAFLGYIDGENQSSATITNCLSVGTFSYIAHETTIPNRGTNTYCYVKQFPTTIPSEMQVTDEQLANGTIAAALGDGWAQDPLTHQPMLKIFATLKQDADDYYLIGSVQDWKNFAELVNSGTNPAANAKMIADVDLGDDQTMVGTYHQKYQGTFDGQGHTLIFNYNTAGMSPEPEQRAFSLDFLGAAPFRDIEGATILNLHTAGSVTAQNIGAAGLVGWTYGTNTIEKCWSDVDIVSSNNTADTFAGFVAFQYGTQLNITDCVYTGKIQSTSKISHAGFVAFQRYGKTSLNNCLLLLDKGSDVNTTPYQNLMYYTFVRNHSDNYLTNTINNCYYLTPFGVAQGTQTTDGDISDGTTAAALQADRSEEIWVQDPVLGIPMLKIFANIQDEDGNYLIGSVTDWKRFADIVNSGTNPAANAKMIADVDLGDDQTYISPTWHGEFSNLHYHGTFDGQGHTLTVHYSSSNMWHTPFSQTSGATIKNLHVAGTIKSTSGEPSHMSGLISNSAGNDVIQNVWVSADITGGSNSWIECGAFIGCNNCGNSTITDCLFTGSITTTGGNNGCFAGWVQSYNPSSITTTNCLSTGTFNIGSGSVSRGTLNNCYVKSYPYSIPSAMQVTDEQLANGNTAAALQADRSEEIWVQDPVLGIPMLKLFAKDLTYTVPSSGYGTFSAKGKVLLPEGLTAHYCKTYNAERSTIGVVNISGNVVPAATGVLLKGTVGETYTLTGATTEAPVIEGNALVAVTEATHVEPTAGEFTNFMMKSGEFKRIAAAAETSKMPANRAYLQIATSELPTGAAGAREITILWDDTTTGITSLTPVSDGNYYTISGVKLQNKPSQKGIYIVNGKKVIK